MGWNPKQLNFKPCLSFRKLGFAAQNQPGIASEAETGKLTISDANDRFQRLLPGSLRNKNPDSLPAPGHGLEPGAGQPGHRDNHRLLTGWEGLGFARGAQRL